MSAGNLGGSRLRASVCNVAETDQDPTDDAVPSPEPDRTAEADARPSKAARAGSRIAALWRFAARHAYLGLVMAAVLVLTRTVDFSTPGQVRVGKTDVAKIVGDAPTQEFSHQLSNPQAVQVRATVRLYADNELKVRGPDPEMDEQGKLLSQPVITTILGMNATVEQTMRLDDGDIEVDLTVHATPRLDKDAKKGKGAPPVILETEVTVASRRKQWWASKPQRRVHLDTRGFLSKVEEHGHRVVFTVEDHLFSLDLEVHRPLGSTLASSG